MATLSGQLTWPTVGSAKNGSSKTTTSTRVSEAEAAAPFRIMTLTLLSALLLLCLIQKVL